MTREVKKYDLFNGGISSLIQDLESKRNQVDRVQDELSLEVANELVQTIQKEASTIDYNYEAYSAVINNNVIRKTDKGYKVFNTTQQATYSEYGTGIIGEQSPHVDPRMSWEYDLNQHGEKGWRYMLPSGTFVTTKGLPSNQVYYRSAKLVRSKIPEIVKRVLERNSGSSE